MEARSLRPRHYQLLKRLIEPVTAVGIRSGRRITPLPTSTAQVLIDSEATNAQRIVLEISMGPNMKSRPGTAVSLSLAAVLSTCLGGQWSPNPVWAQTTTPADRPSTAKELRFPVAYLHGGSWCYGFLYGSDDRIRFEVVQPESAKGFSFETPRAEVMIRQWVLLGTPQNAIELKTRGTTYHMLWLANADEILTGGARRWAPPVALPPYALIAAMQNPSVALAQGGVQPANAALEPAAAPGAAPGPATNGAPPLTNPAPGESMTSVDEGAPNVPPGMLAGVYVSTASSDLRPSNTQFLFYPDGFVMNGVPQEGMLTFDFNHYRMENNPDHNWVGRYKAEGDTIQILWINQFTDPAKPDIILRNETSAHPPLSIGSRTFIPMCRCTGKVLSGTYRWGAPGADQYIQFLPNGTFIDHRVTDQLIVPSRFYDHPRIQNGTYQIARQTLILTFADGHRGTRTFLAPKVQQDNSTFDWISLGIHMLFEENYRIKLSQGR